MQDVGAENAISLCVGDELDHSFDVIGAKRPTVGSEWKFADTDIDPLLFCLVFGETDAGKLGIRVDDASDRLVVYVACFACNDFDGGHSFIFRLVREHRPSDHIPNGVNAFHVCSEMLVYFNALLFIELDTNFVHAHAFRKWAASDGHEHFVSVEFQLLAIFRHGDSCAAVVDLHRDDLRLEMKCHPLCGEQTLEQIRKLQIESDGNSRQKFQ